MTKEIKVLFFASVREHTGTKEIMLELPSDANVIDLKKIFAAKYPSLVPFLEIIVISVNHQFAFDDETIPDNAEVALFPPVSGGDASLPKDYLGVASGPIDLNNIVEQLSSPETGAIALFTGVVRGITADLTTQKTEKLFYEAYTPMAELKLKQVADEIRIQWPEVIGIWIVQRIGELEAGTPTVVVACSAAHRNDGVFEAAKYGIDRLKQIVPIWKKEIGPNGEIWVDGEYIPDKSD